MINQKLPPHNIEAEQALLGAIFLNNDAYLRVSGELRAEHFFEPVHAKIYEVCAWMIGEGKRATPVTLKDRFEEHLVEDITMPQYLARLAAEGTTVINAPDYAQAIIHMAKRRELVSIGDTLSAGAMANDADILPETLIEEAEGALFALAGNNNARPTARTFAEFTVEALNMVGEAARRDGGLSGAPTGLTDLDRLMGGLQRSDLIILAARPGMGKTALATNVAFHLASTFRQAEEGELTQGARVGFFSLEMSGEQLSTRIIADQAGISSSRLRRGDIHQAEYSRLVDVGNAFNQIPLYIFDRGGISIAQLVASARHMNRMHGLDFIVVDYIQLLSGTGKRSSENRVQEITEITTKLKALAKELNVPVLALSQLSRQVESREDKRPLLSDLRESGSIEQDADVVLFVYREEYYLKFREPKEGTEKHLQWQDEMEQAQGKAEIIIAKQRHGATGTVQLHFNADLTRFTNLAREDYMPARMA